MISRLLIALLRSRRQLPRAVLRYNVQAKMFWMRRHDRNVLVLVRTIWAILGVLLVQSRVGLEDIKEVLERMLVTRPPVIEFEPESRNVMYRVLSLRNQLS